MQNWSCLIILLIVFSFNSCSRNHSDENPDNYKTYLFDKYQYEIKSDKKVNIQFEQKGWIVELLFKDKNGCTQIREYSPASEFYEIYTEYFKDGTRRETYKSVCNSKFGEWEFYSDSYNMFGSMDMDSRFWNSGVKHTGIIKLLEKEGWFNLQTGENRIYPDEILPVNGEFYKRLHKHIRIEFSPNVYKECKEVKPPLWYVFITPALDNSPTTIYTINGHTSEFTVTEDPDFSKKELKDYSFFEWQWHVSNHDYNED